MLTASQKWAPQTLPPIKPEPGVLMVQEVKKYLPETVRQKIPEPLEEAAAKSLAFGYGTTFGALYAATRPEMKNLLLEGSALGLASWAAGYLGWLPATGLMPPVTEQKPEQVAVRFSVTFYSASQRSGCIACYAAFDALPPHANFPDRARCTWTEV